MDQELEFTQQVDYPLKFENLEFLNQIGEGMNRQIALNYQNLGTYGKVFLARFQDRQSNPDKLFAIKIIDKQYLIDNQQVHHVLQQASILKQIKHPFIVHAYGFYQSNQSLYIAMNFIRGGDLYSLLKNVKTMNVKAVQFYAANIFLAIDYLHGRNIVYRDLKPQNILIDRYGFLKLADFGLSKILKDQERTYTICGTPQYMAPEILQDRGHSFAVDWWSYGVVLYELLFGYSPFGHDDPIEIYQKILSMKKLTFPTDTHPQVLYMQIIIPILLNNRYAKSLLRHLIQPKLSIRYGNLRKGAWDIRNHKFFKSLNWEKVKNKSSAVPYIPENTEQAIQIYNNACFIRGLNCLKNFPESQSTQSTRNHSQQCERRVSTIDNDAFDKW